MYVFYKKHIALKRLYLNYHYFRTLKGENIKKNKKNYKNDITEKKIYLVGRSEEKNRYIGKFSEESPYLVEGSDKNSTSTCKISMICNGISSSPLSCSSSDPVLSLKSSMSKEELPKMDTELVQPCPGFDYLLKSPSSVLESDLPDESDVIISPVSGN